MAKDDVKPPTNPAGSTEFVFLSLVESDSFDSLGVISTLKTDQRPNGAPVDSIRKVTGGFEISYVAKEPKSRTNPSAGKVEKAITRFIPFSFVKSAIAKVE